MIGSKSSERPVGVKDAEIEGLRQERAVMLQQLEIMEGERDSFSPFSP